MDTRALDVDGPFGFPVEGALDRAERLDSLRALMTHARFLRVLTLTPRATLP